MPTRMLSISLLFSLLLILVLILLVLLPVQAQVIRELAECGGCFSLEVLPPSAFPSTGDFDPSLCASRVHKGTKGQPAIIRSHVANQLLSSMHGGRGSLLLGATSSDDGIWTWNATGEKFFVNGTQSNGRTHNVVPFAFDSWQRDSKDENRTEPDAWLGSPNRAIVVSNADNWEDDVVSGASATRMSVCSFDHEVVHPLLHTNVSSVGEKDDATHISDFQIIPEHVSFEEAYSKCRQLNRSDPNSNNNNLVFGELATFLFENESQTVIDMIQQGKSDVRFHTLNESGFGLWIAGNVTQGSPPDPVSWTSFSTTSLFTSPTSLSPNGNPLRDGAGTCNSMLYCNFDASVTASTASEGLTMNLGKGLDKNRIYKWVPQITNDSITLPFVCKFSYSPNKTLNALSALSPSLKFFHSPLSSSSSSSSENNNSTLSGSNVSIFAAKFYPEFRTFSEAESFCASQQVTNEVGDVASGELATMLNLGEFETVARLAFGTRQPEMALQNSDQHNYGGFWTGLSNSASDTFTNVADLTPQLKWSQSSISKLSYNNSLDWSFPFNSSIYSSSSYSTSIRLSASASGSLGHVAITMLDTNFFTAVSASSTTQKRPTACSFRFPHRANITSYLAVEVFATPMTFAQARTFCSNRDANQVVTALDRRGERFRGSLGYLPKHSFSRLIEFFKKRQKEITKSSPWQKVFVGTATSQNLCLVYEEGRIFFDDCALELPFICQWSVPGSSFSLSSTYSEHNFSTSFSQHTDSHSASESVSEFSLSSSKSDGNFTDTRELSDSKSENLTLSKSKTRPPTQTPLPPPAKDVTLTPVFINTTLAPPPTSTPSPAPVVAGAEATATTAGILSIASGNPVVATQATRLQTSKALASCGTGEELGEEPDRLSSPLMLTFTFGVDDPLDLMVYTRGVIIGNAIFVYLIATPIMFFFALVYSLCIVDATSRAHAFKLAMLRLRLPGVLTIISNVLLPPSSQHSVILIFNNQVPGDIALAIFGLIINVGIPFGYTVWVALQFKNGRVWLFYNNKEEKSSWEKQHSNYVHTHIYRLFTFLTEAQFEFKDRYASGEEDDDDVAMIEKDLKQMLSDGDNNSKNKNNNDEVDATLSNPFLQQQEQKKPNANTAAAAASGGGGGGDGDETTGPTTTTVDGGSLNEANAQSEFEKDFLSRTNIRFTRRAPIQPRSSRIKRAYEFWMDNVFCAMHIIPCEDYLRWTSGIIEVSISAILGIIAGIAAGKTTLAGCIFCFTVDIISTCYHLFHFAYYKPATPRIMQYFTVSASFLTTIAIFLALAQFVVKTIHYDEAFSAISLIQSSLGICTAILGFIGFFAFAYNIYDAYFVKTGESEQKKVGVSNAENLNTETLIDIELELAKLEETQEEAARKAAQEAKEKEELAAAVALAREIEEDQERVRKLEEEKERKKKLEAEEAEKRRTAALPQYELDDESGASGSTKYDLDDEDDFDGKGEQDPLSRKSGAARNSELEMRNKELRGMLTGANKNKKQDETFDSI